MNFDDFSFQKFFVLREGMGGKFEEMADVVKVAELFENGELAGEESPISQKIFKKYIDNTKESRVRVIESVEILNSKLLIDKIKGILEFCGNVLKNEGYSLNENDQKTSLLKIKIWEENKFRLYIVKENAKAQNIEIFLKNGYESFAPEKKMIKAQGRVTIPFDNIWKKYGIQYQNLDIFDKNALFSLIIDSYSLEIFTKG